MSVKHDDYAVHSGLTTNVSLALATPYRVTEARRATIALHQVPSGGMKFDADITIYGAVKDEPGWYAPITTKTLAALVESIDHIDIASINPGRALRFIKIVIENIAGGTLDIHLALSRY